MPTKRSAGILLYRDGTAGLEVLLAHPGGPFFARRDEGSWTIPKGEYTPDEDPLHAARREFAEELGAAPPEGEVVALGDVLQRGGKTVTAWAVRGEFAADAAVSNTFEMQWPPRSGRTQSFPEVDRVQWFDVPTARDKILSAQAAFLDRLLEQIALGNDP